MARSTIVMKNATASSANARQRRIWGIEGGRGAVAPAFSVSMMSPRVGWAVSVAFTGTDPGQREKSPAGRTMSFGPGRDLYICGGERGVRAADRSVPRGVAGLLLPDARLGP